VTRTEGNRSVAGQFKRADPGRRSVSAQAKSAPTRS